MQIPIGRVFEKQFFGMSSGNQVYRRKNFREFDISIKEVLMRGMRDRKHSGPWTDSSRKLFNAVRNHMLEWEDVYELNVNSLGIISALDSSLDLFHGVDGFLFRKKKRESDETMKKRLLL